MPLSIRAWVRNGNTKVSKEPPSKPIKSWISSVLYGLRYLKINRKLVLFSEGGFFL